MFVNENTLFRVYFNITQITRVQKTSKVLHKVIMNKYVLILSETALQTTIRLPLVSLACEMKWSGGKVIEEGDGEWRVI
jgi:hypothetical protein